MTDGGVASVATPATVRGMCCEAHESLPPGCVANFGTGESGGVAKDNWAVLVAGEHWKLATGERMMGSNHCSLEWVGSAYGQIVDHYGRDHVIVIAQLQETIQWLKNAIASGLPLFSSTLSVEESKVRWQAKLDRLFYNCRRLYDDGGSDYDGLDVNPATLIGVLLGNPIKPGHRVVPQSSRGSLFLAIYSHGSDCTVSDDRQREIEATIICDTCGRKHEPNMQYDHYHCSLGTREWYFHMPHPSPPSLYDLGISLPSQSPYTKVFWQQLFQVYHQLTAQNPHRPIIGVMNFCMSGGTIKFWNRPSYKKYCKVDSWPLFICCSSKETKFSTTGSLFEAWFHCLSRLIRDDTLTLGDFYGEVENTYWANNSEIIVDTVLQQWTVPPEFYDLIQNSLRLIASNLAHIDEAQLNSLQELVQKAGVTKLTMCLHCKKFTGQRDQQGLCSTCFNAAKSGQITFPTLEPAEAVPDVLAVINAAKNPETQDCSLCVQYGGISQIQNLLVKNIFGNH